MADSPDFRLFFKDRYRFICTEGDTVLLELITSQLDYGICAIEDLFHTKVEIPFVNVFCCPSRRVLDSFVRLFTQVPTNETRIGQSQGHDMYVLSPKRYRTEAPPFATDQPPFYDVEELKRNLVHELVHVWEELCSPNGAMEVRPVWFSEGLAMYVAGSYQEHEFKARLRDDYEKDIIPKPAEIDGPRNYTWGCILFEFLLKEFGPRRVLDIILNSCEHSVISLLEPSAESFWRRYSRFVQCRLKGLSVEA